MKYRMTPVAIFVSLYVLCGHALANDARLAEKGREIFNQFCYHCHGSDAIQGERIRDLRRLTRRYGDERHDVFLKTVTEGRTDKGMPSWKESLSPQALSEIWAFLESVQNKD